MTEHKGDTFTDQQISEAERIIAADAARLAQLRQQFFVPSLDDAVDHDSLRAPVRRARTPKDPTIQALQKFVRALAAADEPTRRATIRWLADKYLGVRLV